VLRPLLPSARIYVFEGVVDGANDEIISADLIPALSSLSQVRRWSGSGRRAVLHIDTGMNRLGLSASDVGELSRQTELLEGIEIVSIMTHLACADEPEHPLNEEQLRVFDALRAELPAAPTSIGNSAGALLGRAFHGDLVRPGIALYGGNPVGGGTNPMDTVVTVKATVLQMRTLDTSATVGYGATFAAPPGTRVAVVGLGYADGYRRSLSNGGLAHVAGVTVPIIGRVSMDLLCVDFSMVPPDAAGEGSLVELIGPNVLLDDVAEAAGTIGYELLTGLGPRLQRVYLEDD
jgi:alanine racemase